MKGPEAFPRGAALPGMSLRDWFAGQALPVVMNLGSPVPDDTTEEALLLASATVAYKYADAMLAVRGRGQ